MFFVDPFITYLRSYGYCAIRLPKTDLKPLQIFTKNGKNLDRLGNLTTVLVAGPNVNVPQLQENAPAAYISGQRTSRLKVGVGLSILGGIISVMGGKNIGIDVEYKEAKTIAFEFNDVLEDKVEVAKLDQYLADADVSPFSRYVGELLESDDVYITTSTIKSNKFTVDAKESKGVDIILNVPAIQGVVGANVNVSADTNTSSKLTYEGKIQLVFGFQAVRLFYDKGRYTAFEPLEPRIAMRDLERVPKDGIQRLMTDGPFAPFNSGYNR